MFGILSGNLLYSYGKMDERDPTIYIYIPIGIYIYIHMDSLFVNNCDFYIDMQ